MDGIPCQPSLQGSKKAGQVLSLVLGAFWRILGLAEGCESTIFMLIAYLAH